MTYTVTLSTCIINTCSERDIKMFYLMPTVPYQEYENKIIQH